jgi:hypothetical protein
MTSQEAFRFLDENGVLSMDIRDDLGTIRQGCGAYGWLMPPAEPDHTTGRGNKVYRYRVTRIVQEGPAPRENAGAAVPDMSRNAPENAVKKCIGEYLDLRRIVWWRVNNMGVFRGPGRWSFSGTPGIPDIECLLPGGVYCGIETKSKTGRQSRAQEAFQFSVQAAGGRYILARSAVDVQQAFEAWGILPVKGGKG